MTVGKDVAMLFPDVANRAQTDDLELKKLVYLYLINYAKSQPDLAIMAVNTFVKDAQDPNPLVRALAVRTMGCIRVDKIVEYLCDPLARALKVGKMFFLAGESEREGEKKREERRERPVTKNQRSMLNNLKEKREFKSLSRCAFLRSIGLRSLSFFSWRCCCVGGRGRGGGGGAGKKRGGK